MRGEQSMVLGTPAPTLPAAWAPAAWSIPLTFAVVCKAFGCFMLCLSEALLESSSFFLTHLFQGGSKLSARCTN